MSKEAVKDAAFTKARVVRSAADVWFGPRAAIRVITPIVGESKTKQSFKDECDINVIMRRYEATGILPGMERAVGARYIDCTGADFQEAQLIVAAGKSAFAELPARIRARFANDPAKLMEFLADKRNLEEARELGLVKPEQKEATPLAVRVVASPSGDPEQASGTFELQPSPPTGKVKVDAAKAAK